MTSPTPGPDRAARKGSATPRVPPEGRKRRVYIVDDHVILRQGLSLLIQGTPDLMVCGESGSAEEALQEIPRSKADIAIIDLSLEGMSGLELIKSLHGRHPELRMLVLSMHEESYFAERVLRAGANGYVMKAQAIGVVEGALRRILEGGVYVSQQMSDRLLKVMTRSDGGQGGSSMDLLSDREVEVFEMIGRGLGSTEIASKLHLSTKTIESYRARIKEKLDLKDATQLFQHALAWVQGDAGGSRTIPL